MNLSRKIDAVLDALSPADLPTDVAAEEGSHRLALSVTSGGPVGVAFDALEFAVLGAPERSTDALQAWADRLAARVTYLMEPLVLIEHDALAGEAELRSQSPTARGDVKSYYEVRLNKSGAMRLTRVAFDAETRRRRPIPCQMTREVLDRLADDLVACAG